MGKVIDLKHIRKDFPETPLTLEQGLKLLGLKKWPNDWELWKVGIYAESAMGCTGPVVKVPANLVERSKEVLSKAGYL